MLDRKPWYFRIVGLKSRLLTLKFGSQSVRSITIEVNEPFTPQIVETFLQQLLWEKDVLNSQGQLMEIFRLKVQI